MKSSENWLNRALRTLWILWGFALLLLVGLWWVGLTERAASALQAREVSVLNRLPDLEESFLGLEQLGRVLANTTSRDNMDLPLTPERHSELVREGQPYYRLYFLGTDDHQAPRWLDELCQRRLGPEIGVVQALHPLPPGFETPDRGSSEVAPAQYLAFAARGAQGEVLVWLLDWDYVFGDWLQGRLKRFGLGPSLRAEFLSPDQLLEEAVRTPETPVAETPTLGEIRSSDFERRWLVPTFLSEQTSHYGRLQLRLHNRQAVQQEAREHLRLLLAGAVLMAGFALVLVLATRALRAETEYVQAKSRFVSMVGHELRTPVTAIEMYLEILREGLVDDPDKLAEYHGILQNESGRLKSLVENLLTLGLQESGGLQLQRSPVDLGALLEKVVSQENREGRDVVLKLTDVVIVQADPDALYGVFSNLLHNALKYSPAETTVELELTRTSKKAMIQVSDRGTGLPESEYERVFEPYYRSGQTQNKRPGLGLGLALAKELVEAHSGFIQGKARAGGGSVFSVQLELEDRIDA